MSKVSIIVPVYNVEKYLSRCVQSLASQTLRDIEIILVDDGSPDQGGKLCDELAAVDERIKVIHKQNGGLSSARNAGLEVATGETVGFVDSDDDIDLTMYQQLYDVLMREQVDFVMSDYIRIPAEGPPYLKTTSLEGGRYDKDRIRKSIYPQLIMGENLDYGPLLSVWHCLYRRDFLHAHKVSFDEDVRWSEDNIFSAFVGYYADSFYYLKNKGLYHYYSNPGTITTSYRKGCWQVYCTMNHHLEQFFKHSTDYDFSRQLKLHMIYYACNSIGQIKGSEMPYAEKKDKLDQILSSEELEKAFHDFKFPSIWPWKLKAQVELIKKKCGWLLLHY